MSAAHTSGVWTVLDNRENPLAFKQLHVVAEGLTVASITYQLPDADGETERMANARLIAAAPDLLEAARIIEERITYYASIAEGEAPNIEQWAYTDNSGDIAKLRAAIAKATGGAA